MNKMIVISKELENEFVYYIYETNKDIDFNDPNFKVDDNILNCFNDKEYIKNNNSLNYVNSYMIDNKIDTYYMFQMTNNYDKWILCSIYIPS